MFGHTSKTEKIYVVDNVINYGSQEALFDFCKNSMYSFGHVSSSVNPYDLSRFVSNLTDEELHRTSLDVVFADLVKKYYNKNVKIDRSYINIYFPYTPIAVHSDHHASNAVSFLMFINTQWHVDWAGELHFFNDDLSEITKSVIPKGGRAVVFDSSIAHSARSPSILSPVPRYTLTIKAFLE